MVNTILCDSRQARIYCPAKTGKWPGNRLFAAQSFHRLGPSVGMQVLSQANGIKLIHPFSRKHSDHSKGLADRRVGPDLIIALRCRREPQAALVPDERILAAQPAEIQSGYIGDGTVVRDIDSEGVQL